MMYQIKLSKEKNRIYVKLGTIKSGEGERLYHDIKSQVKKLDPGFAAISDMINFYIDDRQEGLWADKILRLLVESGMTKAVRITGSKSYRKEEKTKYGYTVVFAETLNEAELILDESVHKA